MAAAADAATTANNSCNYGRLHALSVCAIFILKFRSYFMSIDFMTIDGNYIRPVRMNEWANFFAPFEQSNWQQQQRRRQLRQHKYARKYLAQEATQVVTCSIKLACVFHPPHCVRTATNMSFTFSFTTSFSVFLWLVRNHFHYISIFGWKSLSFYSLWFLSCIFVLNKEEKTIVFITRKNCSGLTLFRLGFSCHHRIKWPNFEIRNSRNMYWHSDTFFFAPRARVSVCWIFFVERRLQKRSWPNCNANLIASPRLATPTKRSKRETSERANEKAFNQCLSCTYAVKYYIYF